MDPYHDPLPTELEQILDEARADVGLPPARRKAAQGITDMQARIAYHTEQITKLETLLRSEPGHPATPLRQAALADSRQQLTEARARLRDYQTQYDGLN